MHVTMNLSEINIFENLTPEENIELKKFNPYMDFHYSFKDKTFYHNTFENSNGDRVIKFFEHDQIRQGLIITDVLIAKSLCTEIENSEREIFKDPKYDNIFEYIANNSKVHWYWIAIPVISFIKYAKKYGNIRLLLSLDDNLLMKYNLENYVKRKP